MATKIIKALIDGVIQNIEVEDVTSPEQMLSPEERLDVLEEKHEVVFAEGNILIGSGTNEILEMTPEDTLAHIKGASVATMTTAEYEALGESETNANTLYMLTDDEDTGVLYTEQELTEDQKTQARTNIGIDFATDDEIIEMLTTLCFIEPITDTSDNILTNAEGKILIL